MSKQQPNTNDLATIAPPDAFHCPYRKQCFQRELLRWIIIVLIAFVMPFLHGCMWKVTGPGFSVQTKPPAHVEPAPIAPPSTLPTTPLTP